MELFVEITLVISVAAIFGLLLHLLKQPLVIAYIIAGVIVGPLGFNIIQSEDTLEIFSKLGITTLLFIIGLHLNPKVIREVGGISLITGLGQIFFTSGIGFLITLLFGFALVEAIFIAIALTFSSTIIILKLLNDKGDLDKLYGKISIGFLLVQDLVACLILLIISLMAQTGQADLSATLGILSLQLVGLTLLIVAVSIYLFPLMLKIAASSAELLFLFSVTWGLILATAFYLTGLSIEVGALIAGVTLSATAYASEMASRLRPLRDFFIVTFFILLGSQLGLDNLGTTLLPAVVLSIFVLIGNPLIVFYLMNLLGYQNRTGFMAGLTVAQISEFSMILIALAYTTGLVDDDIVSLVTLVGLVTIAVSSYMIIYSNRLYAWVSPVLKMISIRKIRYKEVPTGEKDFQALLFGYGRVGSDYLRTLQKLELNPLIVDFNPEVIEKLDQTQIQHAFGDAEDIEFLSDLPISQVNIVISTLNDLETDQLIVKTVLTSNPEATVIVHSNKIREAHELYRLGATYVVMLHYIGARYGARLIKKNGYKPSAFKKDQQEHQKFIRQRL